MPQAWLCRICQNNRVRLPFFVELLHVSALLMSINLQGWIFVQRFCGQLQHAFADAQQTR